MSTEIEESDKALMRLDQEMRRAYLAGLAGQKRGWLRTQNPHHLNSVKWQSWDTGWRDSQEELSDEH